MKIPWEQFRWYASYHDEGAHPHVHMVCYSADGRSGFLDKEGIARIKSGLAKNIFRQELTEIYRQQTQRRDELVRQSGEVMKELIRQMLSGTLENPRIEQLMGELAQRLKSTSGKKQYGYLKAPLKAVVDEIVDELATSTCHSFCSTSPAMSRRNGSIFLPIHTGRRITQRNTTASTCPKPPSKARGSTVNPSGRNCGRRLRSALSPLHSPNRRTIRRPRHKNTKTNQSQSATDTALWLFAFIRR